MNFSLAWVAAHPQCSFQVRSDGFVIPPESEIHGLMKAKLVITPCIKACCSNCCELGSLLPSTLEITFSSEARNLLSTSTFPEPAGPVKLKQVSKVNITYRNPSDTYTKNQEAGLTLETEASAKVSCSLVLYRGNKIETRFCLNTIPVRSGFFGGRNKVDGFTVTHIDNLARIGTKRCSSTSDQHPSRGGSSTRIISLWKATEAIGSGRNSIPALRFDDRYPDVSGLTGTRAWRGFNEAQNVVMREVSFWYCNGRIIGFQGTYTVDGVTSRGPRRRLFHGREEASQYKLVLRNDYISKVFVSRNTTGTIVCVLLETSLGRMFKAGNEERDYMFEAICLPSDSVVITFFGVLNRGIECLGVIYGDQPKQESTAGLNFLADFPFCRICGAGLAYFPNSLSFAKHANDCLKLRLRPLMHVKRRLS